MGSSHNPVDIMCDICYYNIVINITHIFERRYEMPTKRKKLHYYVLVISDEGPKFVTKVNYGDHTAEWDYTQKPLELDKLWAEDIVLGLTLNMHQAYLICQNWEIEHQPYRYEDYKIQWVEREKEEEDA